MKRFVSSALAVVLALNLCSCRIYGKKQESTEETQRTAPQGEAFSLDGMTADEMMELFESLAVVHNGDDPASYASSFPVPYYPDDSLPDHGSSDFMQMIMSIPISREYHFRQTGSLKMIIHK